MKRELFHAFRGFLLWKKIKEKNDINDSTVVIVLPEKSDDWNCTALDYLPFYKNRKSANRVVLLLNEELNNDEIIANKIDGSYKVMFLKVEHIKYLMNYYCLHRFFDKIVFFFLDYPRDNKTAEILKTTDVTAKELICLFHYSLREVPDNV